MLRIAVCDDEKQLAEENKAVLEKALAEICVSAATILTSRSK